MNIKHLNVSICATLVLSVLPPPSPTRSSQINHKENLLYARHPTPPATPAQEWRGGLRGVLIVLLTK
jgi:hypothetical protein